MIQAIKEKRIMRKCIRCGTEMKENCGIIVKGTVKGIVLTDDKNKCWSGGLGSPQVAICPNCGEVSVYLEEIARLQNGQR